MHHAQIAIRGRIGGVALAFLEHGGSLLQSGCADQEQAGRDGYAPHPAARTPPDSARQRLGSFRVKAVWCQREQIKDAIEIGGSRGTLARKHSTDETDNGTRQIALELVNRRRTVYQNLLDDLTDALAADWTNPGEAFARRFPRAGNPSRSAVPGRADPLTGQIAHLDRHTVTQQHRALHGVAKLANVAWPTSDWNVGAQNGYWAQGRKDAVTATETAFTTFFDGGIFTEGEMAVHFPTDDVEVLIEARSLSLGDELSQSVGTLVVVNHQGHWLLAETHLTPVP